VNTKVLEALDPADTGVVIQRVEAAELDEMWSFVGHKSNQRWLWHAFDQQTGQVLAYALGRRQDEVFLELRERLEPFGIRHFYTDN
jgi:insertion element IS1 protein InsB